MFLMTIPGALSTDTVWSCCPETAGCHEGSWFLLVHNVPFPPNQTQASVFQVVDVAAAAFPKQPLVPAESLAHCPWHCTLSGWMEGGEGMDTGQLWRQMQTIRSRTAFVKGVPRLLPSPAEATVARTCSPLPVDPAGGQAIPPLSCPYFLSFSGKKGGMEWKRSLWRQQQTDKSV